MEYLRQFYEQAEQINNFEIKGENPSQTYGNLLQAIAQFCEGTKEFLRQHIAYLNSKKVEQLENQVETTLASVKERYNTTISEETEKLLKLGEEAQQKEEKRQENFDQIYIQLQNQLTEKPISQYKTIFNDQAKKHRRNAWIWLGVTGYTNYCVRWNFLVAFEGFSTCSKSIVYSSVKSFYKRILHFLDLFSPQPFH